MASWVRLALTEAKLVVILMITLQGMYYEKMVRSSSPNFADIVTSGEHIENGLKTGKIASMDNQTVVKKSQVFSKKK